MRFNRVLSFATGSHVSKQSDCVHSVLPHGWCERQSLRLCQQHTYQKPYGTGMLRLQQSRAEGTAFILLVKAVPLCRTVPFSMMHDSDSEADYAPAAERDSSCSPPPGKRRPKRSTSGGRRTATGRRNGSSRTITLADLQARRLASPYPLESTANPPVYGSADAPNTRLPDLRRSEVPHQWLPPSNAGITRVRTMTRCRRSHDRRSQRPQTHALAR